MELSGAERISVIRLAILTRYQCVTVMDKRDRQTDKVMELLHKYQIVLHAETQQEVG